MNKLHTTPLAIFAYFLFLLLAGCSSTETVSEAEQNSSDQTQQRESRDLNELEELYWQRVQEGRMSFTQADIDFMMGMIGHHAQALIMSEMAPENDASPQIQTLAARIINAQQDEIKTMQNWLRRRDQPVPEIHIEGLNLMLHGVDGHHHHDHGNMPGMLSQQQLETLQEATGREFDRLFLEFMIEHHEGAVTMVDTLFGTDGAAQDEDAFRLAADIHADQVTEVERMQQMLDQMTSTE